MFLLFQGILLLSVSGNNLLWVNWNGNRIKNPVFLPSYFCEKFDEIQSKLLNDIVTCFLSKKIYFAQFLSHFQQTLRCYGILVVKMIKVYVNLKVPNGWLLIMEQFFINILGIPTSIDHTPLILRGLKMFSLNLFHGSSELPNVHANI